MIWLAFLLCWSIIYAGESIKDHSDFYEIDPVRYYFHNGSYYSRIHHTTSRAQMWYTFLKADKEAVNKPLFVFFNGGPGSGTTCGLLGFYTGRKTLDNRIFGGGDKYIDNPYSWTKIGNLLYIDARCTGFSYGLLNPGVDRNVGNLSMEFTGKNFNSYIDAADYIRVLLKFLADRPAIQKNPVVIVGESYGGVRTTLMMHILLNYRTYGDGSDIYQDTALASLIQNHYNMVFPEYANQTVPPATIIKQFGAQILIQPAIDRYQNEEEVNLLEQEGSIVYQIAEEVNETFTPCTTPDCNRIGTIYDFIEEIAGRDLYGCHKPLGWTDSFFNKGAQLVSNSNHFSDITGTDVKNIADMYAAQRSQGYKYFWQGPEDTNHPVNHSQLERDLSLLTAKEQYIYKSKLNRYLSDRKGMAASDFPSIFGSLQPWDVYYLPLNYDANYSYHYYTASVIRAYQSYSYNPLTGHKFLQNLIHVKTFITNAKYDLVVYTNALPLAFRHHTDVIQESLHLKNEPVQAERPGLIQVRYVNGAFNLPENIGIRTIRFPLYTNSSHPVSLTEPEEFYNDVKEWLQEGKLIAGEGR